MSKVGVIFSNLGTPSGSDPKSVGRYLAEFLMDPYVIQLPYLLRFLLVRGIIVPFRSKKSSLNYQEIWTKEGSPLLVETQRAAKSLQKDLGEGYKVVVAMRYGEPSFKKAKEELKDCDKIIFFPQYPQYAESTVQTGLDYLYEYFPKGSVHVLEPYYENPYFVQAYGQFLKDKFSGTSRPHLLMSFHGLPESHLHKTDPTKSHCLKSKDCCIQAQGDVLKSCYRAQCFRSAQAIAQAAGLTDVEYTVSFQSRLGKQKWIEPYTESTFKSLVSKGFKKIAVICPGFPVDGLETLEEIAMTGKEQFIKAGGESFQYIPCLNSDSNWISACSSMVKSMEL